MRESNYVCRIPTSEGDLAQSSSCPQLLGSLLLKLFECGKGNDNIGDCMQDMIILSRPNVNGGLIKPSLMLGHTRVIAWPFYMDAIVYSYSEPAIT